MSLTGVSLCVYPQLENHVTCCNVVVIWTIWVAQVVRAASKLTLYLNSIKLNQGQVPMYT